MRRLKGNKLFVLGILVVLLSMGLYIIGCTSEEDEEEDGLLELDLTTSTGWDRLLVKQIEARGIVSPHVKAVRDSSGLMHIVYFEGNIPEEQDEDGTIYEDNRDFYIKRRTFDLQSFEVSEEELVLEGLDNCLGLDLAIDSNNTPVIAYQGGQEKQCGMNIQADAMFRLLGNSGSWDEYTGAIGRVPPERNPFFPDGYAGAHLSVAFDSLGDIHLGYQFKWEGCDSMNQEYVDLRYVEKQRSNLSPEVDEEAVEGNIYINTGTGIQNSAGANNDILIDTNDEPVVFYYAHLPPSEDISAWYAQGLRVARKQNGSWTYEWIETGIEVGDISCEIDNNGNIGVAYYVTSYTNNQSTYNHCLKYARLTNGTWNIEIVDETVLGGNYCSLSFDSSGNPAVAYYTMYSRSGRSLKNLRLASFSGIQWEHTDVESRGDVGMYNDLFFNENDRVYISTYSYTDKAIYIYFQR